MIRFLLFTECFFPLRIQQRLIFLDKRLIESVSLTYAFTASLSSEKFRLFSMPKSIPADLPVLTEAVTGI